MEQNTPMIAKKIWNLMRVAYFMLKKGICKRKILMDLNLVMKRGKITGKAFQNLIFHHHSHHHGSGSETGLEGQGKPAGEYEFSCSNTPLYRHYFTNKKKNKNYSSEEMNTMFDMMMLSAAAANNNNDDVLVAVAASPALPWLGFGKSPAVRQLRITDSPFPVQNTEDCQEVDAAADDFIQKFYSQLKEQKYY